MSYWAAAFMRVALPSEERKINGIRTHTRVRTIYL